VQPFAVVRERGSPPLLVGAYATLLAATIAVIALVPGVPFYSQANSVQVTLAVDALVVLFLLRGSLLAWSVGVILGVAGASLDGFSMLFGHGRLGFDPKALLTALLEVAAVVVLTSPALERALGRSATAERRSIGSI
jgi:hypothetical protein